MSIFNGGSHLKVYLAAPYQQKELIDRYASDLRSSGVTVTSRWLEETHNPTVQMPDLEPAQHRFYAEQDIQDIFAADILVLKTDPSKTIFRAGRHVEFGMAVAIGLTRPMPIYVIGQERENIFHYLPQVYHFDDWQQVYVRLVQLDRIRK